MSKNSLIEIRNRKKANNLFYTPVDLAKFLIEQIDIEINDVLCDPFKGKGAFFDNFPIKNEKHWFEIKESKDFFFNSISYDWIISNPPFSMTTKILEFTCLYSKKGFAYLLPSYQMSYVRLKNIEKYGFYLNKIVFFKNPKEWNIGFQMAFFIFTKQRSDSIKLSEESKSIQSRLF